MPDPSTSTAAAVERWLAALEGRHLAELRWAEVARALRALSSAYVERRHAVIGGSTLDGAGKRAAFSLFYAPLHFLATDAIVRAIADDRPPPARVLDLGCGTGAAGAAWALALGRVPIHGIDRSRWAADEASWTYRTLGLPGRARQGDAARFAPPRPGTAIVAAYLLNELPPPARETLTARLLDAARQDTRVLVLEPIARSVTPWWDDMAARVRAAGGRADEWTLTPDLPAVVRRLDEATGLDHRRFKVRSLYLPGCWPPRIGPISPD